MSGSVARPLAELLSGSEPDTDVLVQSWQTLGSEEVVCRLAVASPWWNNAARRAGKSGELTITCRGVCGGEIRLGWRAGDVEDLTVRADDARLWQFGTHGTVFGNAPMPDPRRFLVEFSDVLWARLASGSADAIEYLGAGSLAEWEARAGGHANYALLKGPLPLLEAVAPLLDAQGVEYRVVAGPARDTGTRVVVDIGESWLVCAEAVAQARTIAA